MEIINSSCIYQLIILGKYIPLLLFFKSYLAESYNSGAISDYMLFVIFIWCFGWAVMLIFDGYLIVLFFFEKYPLVSKFGST